MNALHDSHHHLGPTLRTARLALRPFRSEDLADVETYFAEPAFRKYLASNFPGADEFISNHAAIDWTERCDLALDLEGEVIGSVHLGCERPTMNGELACLISPRHWGEGLAAEACAAIVDHGFRALGLAKVYARADADNIGSIRTMEKLGMEPEGRLRGHRLRPDGTRSDEVVYGLLRDD